MEEAEQFITDLGEEAKQLRDKNTQLSTALASSSYQGQEGNNLIEFQLETSEMLSKIEHFLRGDYISIDGQGNEDWTKQTNNDLILFNEYGVNSIMSIIGNYVDKNTILSTYDDMRINEILADLGDELAKFIYCNYEVMGMDTEFKKTRFALTVITIIHSIESAYRRALRGQTREDLNSAKIFTQSDYMRSAPPQQMQKKRSLFNPSSG